MTTPALDKVLTALQAVMAAAFPAATVEIDRPVDEDFGNVEIANGAVNIVHQGTVFDNNGAYDQGATKHTASVDLDLLRAVSASATSAALLREMEADAVAALWANRILSGLAQDVRWPSASGCDGVYANVAGRTLKLEIDFLTPVGDHRTVIGVDGTLIP